MQEEIENRSVNLAVSTGKLSVRILLQAMHDPYLYADVPVLKNKLGIRSQKLLDEAEADYVVFRLKDLAMNPLSGDYHIKHLLEMH